MIKKYKPILLAILLSGTSISTFANTYSPFDVTVPDQQGGFTFGADALYMRGTGSNLSYGDLFGATMPGEETGSTAVTGSIFDIKTTYQWGFDATLGYRIPNTGNIVSATWTHLGDFSNSSTNTTTLLSTGVGVPDFTFQQNGNVRFNYDAVDLDLSQLVNFGDHFNFSIFAGTRWADVKEDLTTNYSSTTFDAFFDGLSTFGQQDNEFRGIGPQVGFSGRYGLGWGFGIDADAIASLVVGDVDYSATISSLTLSDGVVTAAETEQANVSSKNRVVPALDGNIGLDYTYGFANCDNSSVKVQAGYKTINYFDVTQNTLSHVPVVGDNGSFLSALELGNKPTSIAFDGPYVGIDINL